MEENIPPVEAPSAQADNPEVSKRKRNLVPFASFKCQDPLQLTRVWPDTKPREIAPEIDEYGLQVIISIEIRGRDFEVYNQPTKQIIPNILRAVYWMRGQESLQNVLMDNVTSALASGRNFLQMVNQPPETKPPPAPAKKMNRLQAPSAEPMPPATYRTGDYPDQIDINPPKKN